jgi:hypothetical protein
MARIGIVEISTQKDDLILALNSLADDYRHSTLPIHPFEILTIRVDYQLAARLTP